MPDIEDEVLSDTDDEEETDQEKNGHMCTSGDPEEAPAVTPKYPINPVADTLASSIQKTVPIKSTIGSVAMTEAIDDSNELKSIQLKESSLTSAASNAQLPAKKQQKPVASTSSNSASSSAVNIGSKKSSTKKPRENYNYDEDNYDSRYDQYDYY